MRKAIKAIILALLLLFVLFPIAYLFMTSFLSSSDFIGEKARFFPSHLSLDNLSKVLRKRGFSTYIKNSIITSTLSAFIKLGITTLAAYAFSHWKFRGKRACAIILLSTLFIPSDAILYENFTTISKLGLLDSYLGIILPGLFSASSLLLLSAAFYSLDKSYYDAAEIDGCSDIQYILFVLLPLTEAVAVTIFLQTFISTFNSYLWPLLVTNKRSMRTIQIAISLLGFGESGEYGAEMMSVLIISLPFIIILALSRKKIEKALMNGYIHS